MTNNTITVTKVISFLSMCQ